MRVAVLPDFVEEGWLSMEYCAERLLAAWPGAERVCPPYRRIASRWTRHRKAWNLDRFINRYILYPQFLKSVRDRYDRFHIVDHSYAHLARSLPGERTGVYCHDLDPFAGVINPASHARWFRKLGRHLLSGLQRAALVFVNSQQTRQQLLQHQLVPVERIVDAPLGVAEEFTTRDDGTWPACLDAVGSGPWILHVGSCVPRKRVDLLLKVFARARTAIAGLKLLKVSGDFTLEHEAIIEQAGLRDAIVQVKGLSRTELAAVYRSAPLVLITSDAEGFGLPALEANACGARVLASDLASLREAGGRAARYAPPGQVDAWVPLVIEAFEQPASWPEASVRSAHAARFTWAEHARIVREAYDRLGAQA